MHDNNCLAFPFQIKLLKTLIVTKDTYVNGLESLKVKAIFKCIIDGAEEWEIPTYQSILRNPLTIWRLSKVLGVLLPTIPEGESTQQPPVNEVGGEVRITVIRIKLKVRLKIR